MFIGRNAWLSAALVWFMPLFAVAIVAALLSWRSDCQLATSEDFAAMGHGIDVAIALSAAYLALDRTRLHRRTEDVIRALATTYEPQAIIGLFERDEAMIEAEHAFLVVLACVGYERARNIVNEIAPKISKYESCSSITTRSMLCFLVDLFDRKVALFVLISICSWQFLVMLLDLLERSVYKPFLMVGVVLYIAGLAVPAISWIWSDRAFRSLERKLQRWAKEIADVRNMGPASAVAPQTPAV